MIYAHVTNGVIDHQGPLPPVWNDGERDWDLRPMSDEELAELGWFAVVYTDRPPNTDTTTWDSAIVLVDGVPTEQWTERPWTNEELAADEAQRNSSQVVSESGQAVDQLVAVVNELNVIAENALVDPMVRELAALLRTVTRQVNREARGTSGRTDDNYTGRTVWIQPRRTA